MLNDKLEMFFDDIILENTEEFDNNIKEIAKKLNKKYYDIESDEENIFVVGSIGRKTAVKDVSDVDIIYNLTDEIFKRFDNYENGGQSALLQEIKNTILERYPTTDISADGQVVVIAFKKYTIELVPAFLQSDNSFKYPDTNDGGKWKITKPFQEQEESFKINDDYNGLFVKLSNLIRCWKDNYGFKFGGLLIDTLVHDFLKENEEFKDTVDYKNVIKNLFEYLKNQDSEQSYWFALGSNQHVNNTDNGKFVKKSKNAFNKIDQCKNDDQLEETYVDLLGNKFSKAIDIENNYSEREYFSKYNNITYKEQYIEDIYPVDIRYDLNIECEVIQDGWRPTKLNVLLEQFKFLKPEHKLKFYISNCEVPGKYNVLWKTRNCGEEAYKKNDIRGEIIKDDGTKTHIEYSKFRGAHYVECYIIKNGICIARNKVIVPINN